MRLIDDWRAVRNRAYSFHFAWMGALLEILGVLADMWSYFDGLLPLSPKAFQLMGILFAVASAIGRLIHQPKISGGSNAD
ncbi:MULTISPECIES: hypothetical protein [Mesorhizobium]|uniref:DUF7940 domain-containing protein n=1 Tax=Mesorhizobium TaxID=68287 RepID=UPI0007A94959|nr:MULTISPECIES: hypothetical protein [Mesorhizobium]AMX93607.1 hypothetical protein A4R28_11120 [Mesorhizobium ciceri]MDF3208299.1 hypothetical protein [Mesorhizobium sp. LMG15046]MDF3229129.1 hypothetical protein [Mesorhizobium sp. DSM 30133]RUU22237.1 hypothetical protein EOC84_03760 [Mesorhizobium sp. Primo-B]RUU37854.1 hypothetical protein EOC83_16455 [Mesorhizobium sp. Primo-A]